MHPIILLLLQLLLIVTTSRLMGGLFRRFHQPAVIGEIISGILLGASFLGQYFPDLFHFLFPASSFHNLEWVSKIALAVFMFLIGMELDTTQLKQNMRQVFILSQCSVFIPFCLGIGVALLAYPAEMGLFQNHTNGHYAHFVLFLGISFGVTAFPVLARIVKARGMEKSMLGTLTLSIAAISDILAWGLLAILMAIVKAGSPGQIILGIAQAILFIAFIIFILKPLTRQLFIRTSAARYGEYVIAIIALLLLAGCAWASEKLGLHLLFGAFMAGALIPHHENLKEDLMQRLTRTGLHWLLPVFFVLNGLRLQLSALESASWWLLCGMIIVIASLGKILGTALPARLLKMPWPDSIRLGILMNTKGLVEIVVLNIGYEMGILPTAWFSVLVIMAIVSTLMTNPLLDLVDYLVRRKKL